MEPVPLPFGRGRKGEHPLQSWVGGPLNRAGRQRPVPAFIYNGLFHHPVQ